MAEAPALPWKLSCAWCTFALEVGARGQHGFDQGAGVEAARRMERHIREHHGKTWADYLRSDE